MGLRLAKPADIMRLVDILVEKHAASIWHGKVNVSRDVARRVLAAFIQRNGNTNDGGSIVAVWLDRKEVIQAFIVGVLDRVYHIGDRLCAQDVYLVATKQASPRAADKLIDAYLEWADANPFVEVIHASWTSVLPEGPRLHKFYLRKGFAQTGAIYSRTPPRLNAPAAAIEEERAAA